MAQYETIRYELPEPGIARIMMARSEVANAQNRLMTDELDQAFRLAAHDDDVRVVILGADGKHFSSGHDLRDLGDRPPLEIGVWGGSRQPGAAGHMAFEENNYFHVCRRWHDLPKPTIAEVHGRTIAGGLMLAWVCDLIVASDDATFTDPVVALGVNGVEWFSHPWELGPRKAKELLFVGDELTAEEARQLGMVNRVVPREELETTVLDMARKIASKPPFALKLAKLAVNQALDAQGFWTAQQAAFSLQQLGHAHARQQYGIPVDPTGLASSLVSSKTADPRPPSS